MLFFSNTCFHNDLKCLHILLYIIEIIKLLCLHNTILSLKHIKKSMVINYNVFNNFK